MSEGARVLVAYATGHGSTRGVAERIATRLAEAGAQVDARPVDDVDDLEGYNAVVLGSGVYNQSWIPSATGFLRANSAALAARPVWLFSVGMFGDTHRGIGKLMRREPREIGEFHDAIHPREYRVFAGAIQRHQWPPLLPEAPHYSPSHRGSRVGQILAIAVVVALVGFLVAVFIANVTAGEG